MGNLDLKHLEQWKLEIEEWLRVSLDKYNVAPIQLYAAAAVLIFTTILLFSSQHVTFTLSLVSFIHSFIPSFKISFSSVFIAVRLLKRTKSNTVVLTGLSGAGKTVLFYRVILTFSLTHIIFVFKYLLLILVL